jgi:phospholipid/cholesterol/gamma-HCH transport system substrate-binding protein
MIRRAVRIQLIVFALITVLGITYAGFAYVGIGQRFINKPYTVTALAPSSGGIFSNAEVTMRGVQVGKVSGLTLVPHGVKIKLSISHKYRNKIPKDTSAVVADLSAVGEQYVDLEPAVDVGPYLQDGDVIQQTAIPLDDATLLLDLDKLVSSVDRQKLATVITGLNQAFAGTGPDLARLIVHGDALTRAVQAALPQTVRLINDGKTVLDTQQASANDLKSFAANLARLSDTLRADNPAFRNIIDRGVVSANETQRLIQDNAGALGALVSNLATVSQIQAAPVRLDGLRTILTIYPSTVYNGFRAAPGDNKAHFGIINDMKAPNCTTQSSTKNGPGFVRTKDQREGSNTKGQSYKAKLDADCLLPHNSPSTVRGGRNAPRPPGDHTGDPSNLPKGYGGAPEAHPSSQQSHSQQSHSQQSQTSRPAAQPGASGTAPSLLGVSGGGSAGTPFRTGITTYDPYTDLLQTSDGKSYLIGSDGGQYDYYGADAWKFLLLAPTIG